MRRILIILFGLLMAMPALAGLGRVAPQNDKSISKKENNTTKRRLKGIKKVLNDCSKDQQSFIYLVNHPRKLNPVNPKAILNVGAIGSETSEQTRERSKEVYKEYHRQRDFNLLEGHIGPLSCQGLVSRYGNGLESTDQQRHDFERFLNAQRIRANQGVGAIAQEEQKTPSEAVN